MKRKSLFTPTIALVISISAYSQVKSDSLHRNTLKVNAAAIMLNNVSLMYERDLNAHWTLQMGGGYRWGGDIPKVFGLGDVIITSPTRGLGGFSVTPEVRYYFNFCGCGGPKTGFYAGAYGRFTKFNGNLNFNFWNGSEYLDVGGVGNIRELGVGIQLGYQFVFKKRFVVDLMFAGPRTSWHNLHLEVESSYVNELIPILEEEINKRLEWLGRDPITINPTPDLDVAFGFTNFRYGIGFGYRF